MDKLIFEVFEGKKVLVVGGAGFVGSNLVKLLLKNVSKVEVVVIDNFLSAEKENLPEDNRLTLIEGSISSDDVLAQLKDDLDYVFHLATYHGNQSSIANPLADHENNTLTTLKLLEKIHTFKKIKKLVYSSAGCSVAKKTFDEAEATNEDSGISLEQDSPYSLSKIFGEFYCYYYFRSFQFPAIRVRFQNVYGPGEVLGAGEWRGTPATVWRNVAPTFVYKSIKGAALPVDNGGVATRDFIYVEDICRGLVYAAIKGEAGEVYNLASGKEISILELANTINQIVGNKTEIKLFPKRDWDTSGKRFGDPTKAKEELGFVAQMPFNEGMKLMVQWTKDNLEFIESCIAKHSEYVDSHSNPQEETVKSS